MYNNLSFIKPKSGIQLNRAHPLAKGLVGYWPLNEGGGSKTYDVSGNGNHGTLTNFALSGATSNWAGSPMGGGLNFDGTNDYVNCGDPYSFSCANTTISLWMMLNSLTVYPGLFYNGNAGANGWGPRMSLGVFCYFKGGVGDISSGITAVAGAWYHVVWTVNSTYTPSLYLNGVLRYVSSNTSASLTPTTSKWIGTNIGNDNFLNGVVDEVRVYNKALHPSEIQTLYVNPHIDFHSDNLFMTNPTLYGLGAWKGNLINAGASGTLTADSVDNNVEAAMALSFKKA